MTQQFADQAAARIVVTDPEGNSREFRVGQREIVIGRDSSCDVVVQSNRKTISRKHAAIEPEGAHYLVRDLASQNGVFVNGMRITDSLRLTSGDEISLGLHDGITEVKIRFFDTVEDSTADVDGAARTPTPFFVIRWPDGRLTTYELRADR